jgi:hypothetical protein
MSANLRCRSFDRAPIHRKVHNICRNPTDVSPDVLDALGLGLGFGLSLKRKDENPIDFDRLRKDLRTRYFFRNTPPRKLNFPKLYVKSPDWVPDNAHKKIELALTAFETATNEIFKKSRQVKHVYNLHPSITNTLRDILTSQRFCVTATDKNLGPAILDMDLYIARAHADHLGNTSQYLEISKDEAHTLDLANFRCILKLTVDDLRLDKESTAFFTKKLCGPRDKDGIVQMPKHLHLPYFYLLPKVHKTPWKTRPVVSGVSSVNEPLSKWIDIQLQRVVHLCPVYLKDSWQLLRELRDLPTLPSDATCFTADAVSMYTNIDNSQGIATIGRWLELHRPNLPSDFPSIKILEGLDIIMRNNVFAFGSHYFKQCNGTAMGTPCACTYATIYYSYHEETSLLQPDNNLLFYRRLIDDAFIIQRNIPDGYEHFMQRMNSFGDDGARLEWESPGPSRAVDFLDLHIKLNPNGSITTSTYQKPMNLYLFRPPTSAQPPSILYGLIYGTLHRLFWQNSEFTTFEAFTLKFFKWLQARGHATSKLATLFLKAATRVDLSSIPLPKPPDTTLGGPDGTCFLHLPFHPQDAPRREIQQLFADICLPAFEAQAFHINRLIIAYSRTPSISDNVRRNRLGVSVDTTKVSGSAV